MTRLQEDVLEFYNSLQEFSKKTLEGPDRLPIHVAYDQGNNSISFEQKGKKVYLPTLNFYAGALKKIKDSWLLPEDYDFLMRTMSALIENNILVHNRVCVSPEYYGFDIYETSVTPQTFKDGPQLLGTLRFVSGNGWIFRLITKYKYRNFLL